MSELIAEARVLVTPDTTAFRAQLVSQLTKATAGVVVPVPVTPVAAGGGTTGLVAAQQELTAATVTANAAMGQEQALLARGGVLLDSVAAKEVELAGATEARAAAEKVAATSAAAQARQLGQLERGAAASALTFAGLRGATLAASGAFIAGTAGVVAFGKAIKTAVSFQQELNVFRVTTGATADEMVRVSKAAQDLGRDLTLPGVSAGDAAQAMTELAKAGLSVENSIAGARGVLQLATAAQISNADATQLAASALNAFGLGGDKAVHVADLLANAANAAQGGISDMGLALSQSAAVARQVGLSLDDTVALLSLLAKNGLQGSDAGTSLRVSLLRLVNPTKQARQVLKELNIQLRDQQGNIRPEVFAEFARATQGLAKSQRDAKAAIVFGQDAIRTEAILGREGAAGLDQMRIALERQGTAADVAAARNTGLAGAIANVQNQLDTAGIAIGNLATGPLTVLADAFATNVQDATKFINTLERIPTEIPFPKVKIGPIDTEQGGQGLADRLRGAFGDAIGHAFERGFIERIVPGGAATIGILDALFPQEKIDTSAAKAGAELRSGIEDASRAAVQAANAAGPQITTAIVKAFDLFNTTIASAIKTSRANITKAIASAGGQQAGLEEAFNAIIAGGGSLDAQIANLRKQAAVQAKIIADAGPGAAGEILKARRAAQAKLASINQQITSLQNQEAAQAAQAAAKQQAAADKAAAAAKQHAQDIKNARAKADQAVIDSLAPLDQRTNLAQAKLGADATLQQQLAVQVLIANTASKEIAIVEKSVKDVQTRNSTIRGLVAKLVAAGTEIDNLNKQIAAAASAKQFNLQELTFANRELSVQLTNSDKDNEQLARDEIAFYKKAARAAGLRTEAGKQLLAKELQAELTLKQILDARKQAAQTAQDGIDAGTTLVDLFKSTQDIVRASGNVGQTASQVTSSAANQPIRDIVNQRLDLSLGGPLATTTQNATTATDRLTEAINNLINTLTGGGTLEHGGIPSAAAAGALVKQVDTATRFKYQRIASSIVEAGIWG